MKLGKRRSFLLLELFVGLSILCPCLVVLSKIPLNSVHEQYTALFRIQAPHLADCTYAKVKEQLYRKEIPWKKIVHSAEEISFLFEDKIEVQMKPLEKKTFLCRASLKSAHKKAEDGEEWYLTTIKIRVAPQEKKWRLFLSKKQKKLLSKTFNYQVIIRNK